MKRWIQVLLWLPMLLGAPQVLADYPERAVRIIVAYPPGAVTDVAARLVGEHLAKRLGRPVIVENRAGANGIVGTAAAAKAPADGYTLLLAVADTHSINPHIYKTLQYDPIKDFEPITQVSLSAFALIARPSFEQNSLQELIAAAKKQPGKITYGTWGIGSAAHASFSALESAAGIQLNHIPYQGSAPALTALVAGQIDLFMTNASASEANLRAGKVKALGMAAPKRSPLLPGVPTFAEQGLGGTELASWYGLVAPAGVPRAVLNRLSTETVAVLKTPEVADRLTSFGWEVVPAGPEAFGAFMRAQLPRWGKVIKEMGLQFSQ